MTRPAECTKPHPDALQPGSDGLFPRCRTPLVAGYCPLHEPNEVAMADPSVSAEIIVRYYQRSRRAA